MLQLVLGIAGSGKTTRLLDAAAKRAAAGKNSILLVPEQFSSAAEALAWRRLGDVDSAFVEVLSFRTLAERILKLCGGIDVPVLGDAGRAVFVRRALDAVGDSLSTYARQRKSAAFCNLCAQTLAELKTAGATPASLRKVATEQGQDKLWELSLIYEAYEAELEGAALDPDDRLVLAARRADCGYFTGKACFVDGFDGFTAPEYEMLAQVLLGCKEVTVALCCDKLAENAAAPDLFTPVRRCATHLLRLAQKAGMAAAPPTVLPGALRPRKAGLLAANLLLAHPEEQADAPESSVGVHLTQAADEWEEVRLAAAEMRRLALAGVPYSRMALVCRDVAAYESVVRRQLALYGVPCFIDAPSTIEHTAPIAFLRAGLHLMQGGLSSPTLLALLKTGLCGCGSDELAALENYVFTWQPKAAEWRAPFAGNPEGLMAEMDEVATRQLALAEGLRARVVPLIEEFLRKKRGSAMEISKNLYLLMDRFDAPVHAEEKAALLQAEGDTPYAEQSRRAWDLAMQMLDQMVAMLADEAVDAVEYEELLLILVRSTDFGKAPQTLECVQFSGADRMRLAEPDYCFVVGLCEGEFPMQVGYSGLLTHTDRDLLVAGGIEMPGSFENRVLLEEMFFYRALTAAREGLYLSWPARRAGVPRTRSAALQPLADMLAPPALALPLQPLAGTPAATYDLLGAAWREDAPLAATLAEALHGLGQPGWDSALALLEDVDNLGRFVVQDTAALAKLVGHDTYLSATTAERYYECQFSYYMERILRVRPRRRAEVSPLESGNFVHYVLEQVLREEKDGFAQRTDEELSAAATRHGQAFIAAYLPAESRRTAFLLGQILDTTTRLLCYMRNAAAQSEFSIDAVELRIAPDGDVAPLTITAPDGSRLHVSGMVDRVDVLHRHGNTYLLIVDYKTGDKRLDLDELYCGINMQMLIYMDALCENGSDRWENPMPAGVLYLGADPRPATGGREEEGAGFSLNGLLLDDGGLLRALDADAQYIPVHYKRDGTPGAHSQVASAETFAALRGHVRGLLADMAAGVRGGSFAARPLVKGVHRPCVYCPYRPVCRHEDGENEQPVQAPPNAFAPDAAEEVEP
ncbi:PD-(D/E)XK nuclease family protein [Ruminococcaceae bacterium OttesenSCG-928-O06]|nr:PD-(D/E)XK nuclease family protein [Ruminococcaceae bacterium OttesenSCG-928-O06]